MVLSSSGRSVAAQDASVDSVLALELTTTVDTTRFIAANTLVEFALNRPLAPSDGELVLLVGGVDVTALADVGGQRLAYRPGVTPMPAGATEIVVYQKRGVQWTELRRLAVKVLTASGFTRALFGPTLTVGNKGQLAEGRSSGIPDPERRTYQDLIINGTLTTTHERSRFTLETSSNYVGASRRKEALRFGKQGNEAPRFDLADYRVTLRSGHSALTLGQTSFGNSRHLVNAFSSRGASLAWTRGSTQLTLGALSAAPIVGWDHPLGLDRPNHRMLGASLGREFIPRHPGALRVETTVLNASMLPINGFTQGAVVDAETSAGGAVQFAAATPGQRIRLTGGIARSRFDNPRRDAQLTADTVVIAVERETRGARFFEANLAPVQNHIIRGLGAVNVGVAYRHERIDPLYRSVTAQLQADRQQDAADATFALGAISGQLGWSSSRDNLGGVPSILTTRGRVGTANLAVPIAQLVHATRRAAALPTLTLVLNRSHQRGDALPAGNVFRPQDFPNQLTTTSDLGAQWQVGRWRLAARRNRARQDNRQVDRELADFSTGTDALSVGTSFGTSADMALDVGDDFQRSEERGQQTDTRRLTLNANLRRGRGTSFVLAISLLQTRPPTGPSTVNGEQRAELTQPLTLLRDASGGARGQFFLRLGRSTARLPDFARQTIDPMSQLRQRQWALSSGLNLRVF